jgi:uncharacterized protein (DUF2235 family)
VRDDASDSIGIFIDGTGNFWSAGSNVRFLYSAYQGTKFYHGGVGNPEEYSGGWFDWKGLVAGGTGKGSSAIMDRTYRDIVQTWKPGRNIDIIGFSRGAATSNELARKIGEEGLVREDGTVLAEPGEVRVRFLGLFDPVYSMGLPGQNTVWGEAESTGTTTNYVESSVPSCVDRAAVALAWHEERTWFPATKLSFNPATTHFSELWFPGVHSDVGGHKDNNQFIMRLCRSWMGEYAAIAGARISQDQILSRQEWTDSLSLQNLPRLGPGDYGVQNKQGMNPAWLLIDAFKQPLENHLRREHWRPGLNAFNRYGPHPSPADALLELRTGSAKRIMDRK